MERVDPAEASRLHALLRDLIRAAGLLQTDDGSPHHTVSLSQAFALHELDTDTGLSQRDLAERLRLEKSSVSRLAAEMERKGFLVRERDPDDQRQYRLRLTDEGRAQHAAMRANFHERYEVWVTHMTAGERAALLKGLPALIRVMHQHHD